MEEILTRHRLYKPWFGKPKLVLEIGTLRHYDDSFPPSLRGKPYYSWRDATLSDIKVNSLDLGAL